MFYFQLSFILFLLFHLVAERMRNEHMIGQEQRVAKGFLVLVNACAEKLPTVLAQLASHCLVVCVMCVME